MQSSLTGLREVVEYVALLLAQRVAHGEYALDEAAARRTVGAEAALAPQHPVAHEPSGLYILFKGTLSLRKGDEEVARVEPVSCAGVVSALTGDSQPEEVVAEEEGIVMHVSQQILQAALTKDLELFQRLSRNAINTLVEQLTTANVAQSEIALERDRLRREISEAEIDLNDARMIASMRGDTD